MRKRAGWPAPGSGSVWATASRGIRSRSSKSRLRVGSVARRKSSHLRNARGQSLRQVIDQLNPVLRGWVAYFRPHRRTWRVGGTRWLDSAEAAHAPLATLEAPIYTHAASAADGHPSMVAWWWRRCPHAFSLSSVLVRPHGFAPLLAISAVLVGFMNRPLRNGMRGGVGGRRE